MRLLVGVNAKQRQYIGKGGLPPFSFYVIVPFMPDLEWTEERVRQLLLRAEPYSRAGSLLGARLGALLRRLDPDFKPGVLGDQNLKLLLAHFPDLGTIEPYAKSLDFVFCFSADRELLDAGFSEMKSANALLKRDLWLALVAKRPHEARYIDLHTIKVVVVQAQTEESRGSDAPSPIAQEPERYLSIPLIPQDDLRALAHRFAESISDSVMRERLASVIDREGWFRPFTKAATDCGLGQPWLNAHRAYVVETAISWLKSHNIDPRRFLRRSEQPWRRARTSSAPAQLASELRQENVREVVLRAVSRMSDQELLNLPIPLRHLIS